MDACSAMPRQINRVDTGDAFRCAVLPTCGPVYMRKFFRTQPIRSSNAGFVCFCLFFFACIPGTRFYCSILFFLHSTIPSTKVSYLRKLVQCINAPLDEVWPRASVPFTLMRLPALVAGKVLLPCCTFFFPAISPEMGQLSSKIRDK